MKTIVKWAVIMCIGYCIYKGIVKPEDIGQAINKVIVFGENVIKEIK